MQNVLSLLSLDRPAALISRVVELLRRKGHRVTSAAMASTPVPGLATLTVVIETSAGGAELARCQLEKLPEILAVNLLASGENWLRTLAVVRLSATPAEEPGLLALLDQLGARLLERTEETIVAELSHDPATLERMISDLGRYQIRDVARTSPAALPVAMLTSLETIGGRQSEGSA